MQTPSWIDRHPVQRLWLWMGVLVVLSTCTNTTSTPVPTSPPTLAPTATATSLPTPTPVPTPMPGLLYVDAAQSQGPISPYVYGSNIGPWNSIPLELLPLAEEAHLTYLRFPGGNYGDQQNLRSPQIDQFIKLCKQLGAEPSISVRLYNGTPEQAAELVRYTNIEKQYGVRYWSIGNEPELYDDYNTERHNKEWRAIALAMREVDPTIVLIGPEITQFTGNPAGDPKDSAGRDWLREFLTANGDLVDIVSIHRYPFPQGLNSAPATVAELEANPVEWDRIIPALRSVIRETTGRDIPVAVTEVNSYWSKAMSGESTPDSHASAIWWADVLGRLIRQDVDIVAQFAVQSTPTLGGWGLFSSYEARPAYYVYRLYQKFGTERRYASSDDPDLSIYAAARPDGALTLMVINRSAVERTYPLHLDNIDTTQPAEIWQFDQEHPAESPGTVTLSAETQLTLPPLSATLYILPAR